MSRSHQNMVLSAKDVAYLISNRECLGKLVLSVQGTVTALSDVTRVGKNQMILVEVEKCIILVIQDFHLGWHLLLEVGDTFLFQNLRLTTLKKGISKPCSVLLVLETSSLTCLKEEDAVTPISLQDWLKMNNIHNLLLKSETSHDADGEEIQELVNYEGTITSVDMAPLGIFVLDSKLRLVITSNCVAGIRRYCRVSVYNAHIVKIDDQAYLVCCKRSYIRIHKPLSGVADSTVSSSADSIEACAPTSVEDSVDNRLGIFIKKMIKRFGLNLKEILALQQLYSILSRQGRSKSWQEKLFAQFVKSDVCAHLAPSGVPTTDLFIFHQQLCPFNQSKSEESRIPQIMSLLALKKEVANIKSTLKSTIVSTPPGINVQSSSHHLKVCFSSGKILVGSIMMCSEGTVFQDGAAQLRAIILSDSDVSHRDHDISNKKTHSRDVTDYHSQPHSCCQCCCGHCQPGKQLTCPHLDPWLVGATICVTRFHVVLEGDFDARTSDAQKSAQENSDSCIYLAFSLLDCILLDTTEHILPAMADSERDPAAVFLPANLSSADRQMGKNNYAKKSTCYLFVHEKKPLTYTGNQFKNGKSCQFELYGCKIDVDFNTETNTRCCGKVCVKRRKSTFTTSSEFVAEGQENSLQGTQQKRLESICVSFFNSTAKWYSCFSSGHLYRLLASNSSSGSDPFEPKLLKILPQKVAERYNVRMNIEVPEDLFVERLPLTLSDPCLGLHDVSVLHPLEQILSASFPETVVSFKGVIVGRHCEASFKQNVENIGRMFSSMINSRLEVQDMLQDSTDNACGRAITIYLDAPKTVYTLGLVPGAVVKFHRVERKVSKAGNIYCRFIAISVAEVVQFQDLSDSPRRSQSQTRDICIDSLPRELLYNMRQCTDDSQLDNLVFAVSCHIEKIFSLHIKTVCSSCRSVFSKTGCQSRDCSSANWPVATARAVLLVNDGSCPATVKIWDSNLICRLLTLTHDQWEDLVTEVTGHGEVVLDNSSPPTSTIAIFLQELISSPLVLRLCKMAVKKYRGSVSSDLDKKRLEDFQENEVRVGRHFLRTLSLPRMQLDCLAISEIG